MPVYVNDTAAYGVRSGTSYHAFVTGNYGKLASVSGHSNTYILESAMLSAVKAAGGAAWYVPDDFLTLGQNLITNGGPFVNSTGWANTTGAAASISGSYLRCTSTAIGGLTYSIQTTPGKQYLVSSNVAASDVSHGLRIFRADGSTAIIDSTYYTSPGVLSVTFAALDATSSVYLRSAGAGVVDYSSVTVQEILSAKDWQDTSGTLPGYLSGTVGLLTDRSYGGELGPELVSTWAAQNAATISSTNTLPVTCTATVSGDNGVFIAGPPAGKQYAVSVAWSGNDEGRTIQVRVGSAYTSLGSSVSGSATIIAYADNTNNLIVRAASSAVGDTYTITALSVRELKGAHASQATSGNRPTITRIPRKLGPELILNGTGDSAAEWTGNVSVSGGELVLTSVGDAYPSTQQSFSTTVGKTYWFSGARRRGTGAWAVKCRVRTSDNVEIVNSGAAVTTSASLFGLEFKAATSVSRVQLYASDAATSTAGETAMFDNISVREVLEWSYALTFDGSNDSLAAPASVIGATLTQGHTMISWGRMSAIGAYRRMVGDGVRMLGVESNGKSSVYHAGVGAVAGSTTLVAGQPFVLEETWDGATAKLYLNGVLENSAALAAPTGTPVSTAVGQTGSASSYWQGEIGGAVVCPAVMTDAQRAAVRKFAAAQLGMSL